MKLSLLEALSPQHGEKRILTIDGPAGAGKTTFATELSLRIRLSGFTVETIHMDDLYNGWERALTEDLSRTLLSIVSQYRTAEVTYKMYDWHKKSYETVKTFASPEVLILEGVGSGQRSIRNESDLALWIEAEPDVALQRVIERDGEEIRPFMKQWLLDQAAHHAKEETQGAADYCIDGAP